MKFCYFMFKNRTKIVRFFEIKNKKRKKYSRDVARNVPTYLYPAFLYKLYFVWPKFVIRKDWLKQHIRFSFHNFRPCEV
jgi:hypothetical protein